MKKPEKPKVTWKKVQGQPGVVRYTFFKTTVANIHPEGSNWRVGSDLLSVPGSFPDLQLAKQAVEAAFAKLGEDTSVMLLPVEGDGDAYDEDCLANLIEDVPDYAEDEDSDVYGDPDEQPEDP